MQSFLGIIRYEYRMAISRWGLWIAFGLLYVFYGISVFAGPPEANLTAPAGAELWKTCGQMAYLFNMFMPLIAGIMAADRAVRDVRLNVRELQQSSPLGGGAYVLGKYLGVLLGVMTPAFLWVLVVGGAAALVYKAPLMFPVTLLAFVVIQVPAFAFVAAFSLACPLIMPLRVYQVLFTGYWFWGNFLNPKFFPTLNGTLLTPGGMYAFQGFFGGMPYAQGGAEYTATQASLNLLVLAGCIVLVLIVMERYQSWQAQRA